MKVVINSCYGGYGLSKKAYEFLGLPWNNYGNAYEYNRTAPELIKCIEELGERANGNFAKLKIVEIPDDVKWEITEYDGIETVEEIHRRWS